MDYQLEGQLDSALVYYDKADVSAPNTAIILHERGLLKSSMRNYKEAFKDLDRSIALTNNLELKKSQNIQ